MDIGQQTLRSYYRGLLSSEDSRIDRVSIICVMHTVGNSPQFVWALSQIGNVKYILAKSSSYSSPESTLIQETMGIPVDKADRSRTEPPGAATSIVNKYIGPDSDFLIADVGGYFATSVMDLHSTFDSRFCGVLEGTENGHKRYLQTGPLPVPVVSVARSPLKDPEDYLVGAGVVFSVEAILREMTLLPQGRRSCVIGFGKIGVGVADALRGRGIPTAVCESNPIRRAVAAARGYAVYSNLELALTKHDLIISATGGGALTTDSMMAVPPGTIVASVTSADDEFRFADILSKFSSSEVIPGLTEYRSRERNERNFFLVNNGNSANFLHGAVEGPALELINGEKISVVSGLARRQFEAAVTVQELAFKERKRIADVWSSHFVTED